MSPNRRGKHGKGNDIEMQNNLKNTPLRVVEESHEFDGAAVGQKLGNAASEGNNLKMNN